MSNLSEFPEIKDFPFARRLSLKSETQEAASLYPDLIQEILKNNREKVEKSLKFITKKYALFAIGIIFGCKDYFEGEIDEILHKRLIEEPLEKLRQLLVKVYDLEIEETYKDLLYRIILRDSSLSEGDLNFCLGERVIFVTDNRDKRSLPEHLAVLDQKISNLELRIEMEGDETKVPSVNYKIYPESIRKKLGNPRNLLNFPVRT